MGQMSIMGRQGDSVITWDPKVESETNNAREAFSAMRDRAGMTPYRMTGEGKGERMTEFDPDAKEIVFATPMAGG